MLSGDARPAFLGGSEVAIVRALPIACFDMLCVISRRRNASLYIPSCDDVYSFFAPGLMRIDDCHFLERFKITHVCLHHHQASFWGQLQMEHGYWVSRAFPATTTIDVPQDQ